MFRISLFLTIAYAFTALTACYGPSYLPKSRLKVTKQLSGIQYVALDANMPVQKIWLLSDVTIDDQSLSARFTEAPEGFGQYVDNLSGHDAKKANRDFVYLYIHSYYTAGIKNQSIHRVEFNHIKKVLVFEPEIIDSNEIFCVAFCGAVPGLILLNIFKKL